MDLIVEAVKKNHGNKVLPEIDLWRCSGCNKCVDACKQEALELFDMNANKNSHRFFKFKKIRATLNHPDKCTGCKVCASVCKHTAIKFNY